MKTLFHDDISWVSHLCYTYIMNNADISLFPLERWETCVDFIYCVHLNIKHCTMKRPTQGQHMSTLRWTYMYVWHNTSHSIVFVTQKSLENHLFTPRLPYMQPFESSYCDVASWQKRIIKVWIWVSFHLKHLSLTTLCKDVIYSLIKTFTMMTWLTTFVVFLTSPNFNLG